MTKTILYYTSNREDPAFEEKIRANIIKNRGDLPIISVSQKPINFGKNICVGDVGFSYLNEWRQILIGAKAAKTKYLVFAESDFLYPKEYFAFEPSYECIYRYRNVWIVFAKRNYYFRKKYSEGAQIVRRDYIIDALEYNLKGVPKWFDGRAIPWQSKKQKVNMHSMPYKFFNGKFGCITFKTGSGVRKSATIKKRGRQKKLPFWGHIKELKKEYGVEKNT